MICWTLGITEHHVGVNNVLSLINLALLCGHVGRYGSGLNPLRGQNNVQGGGDMGAIPNKLTGFQDLERDEAARAKFEAAWNCTITPRYGWHLTQMFHAMERGELRTLYVIGENPAQSEADVQRTRQLLRELDFLVVQDIFLTATAELADVVLPSAASWCEAEGTVTNSERRVQRTRKALEPPGDARDDMWILSEIAKRLGHDWGDPTAEQVWDEVRSLSPMHAGMRYDRLEALGGIQWPCPDEDHPGSPILHERLWLDPVEGPLAPFTVVEHQPPYESLDAEYPLRLTTGRRLESYNTGAQTNRYSSPLHRGESLDLAPEDADRLLVEEGEIVKVSSRRGSVDAPVHIDRGAASRPLLHDVPLPRAGRLERAHDRRHRPAQRHRGVQGRGDPRGQDRVTARHRPRRGSAAGRDHGRLMDIHPIEAEPTSAERAAVDHLLGPPETGWTGGVRRPLDDRTAARWGPRCAQPPARAAAGAVGGAGAHRMDQPGRAQLHLHAPTVPPADAYGVATFYAMLATDPRPPRVIHVCEDLACKCVGSDDLIAQLEERFGPEGDLSDDGSATWYRSPCLGQCDRAPAALVTDASETPDERVLAPTTARDVLAALAGEDVPGDPVTTLPQTDDSLRLLARVGRIDPVSLDAYRATGGYETLRVADRPRPRRRHPRGQGLEADGPRRRRVPDRREVGGRRPPAGPPALPDLQRRRVRARHVQGPRRDRGRSRSR